MSEKSLYLSRYAWQEPLFPETVIHEDTGLIIVIPAYNEPDILKVINCIQKCKRPKCEVLILVVFNESLVENPEISTRNENGLAQLKQVQGPYPVMSQLVKLTPKKAGVGLARKIGMDEAVRFFNANKTQGIITCFDADCTCEDNFLIEIEKHFEDNHTNTALTFYEHPLDGEHTEAIINYELYLRYYVNALRWAGFPYAFQTLGSCISVHAAAYQKQGGMNTRKAGEDFYFIHKMTALGGISEVNTTTIYPSDRLSERVPFGTGHAIGKYLDNGRPDYPVYAPGIFENLKKFFDLLPAIYNNLDITHTLPLPINTFLQQNNFTLKVEEIISQTTDYESFKKRFFSWMDGLKVLKLVHHCRDHHHKSVTIDEAIDWMNKYYLKPKIQFDSRKEALLAIRKADRHTYFYTK